VFESPARASILPQLVSRELFPRAVTVSSTITWLAFATGPMLMGFAAARGGIAAAYGLHAGLALVSIASLLRLPALGAATSARISWEAIREGLAFVWRSPVVLGCMTLDMFAVILGGATGLLPIYATEILHVGADGYGLLSSSLELGALVMSAALIFRPAIRRTGPVLLAAVAAYGVATIVFGLSRWFPLSVLAYMAAGMADAVSVVLRGTAIQLSTPDALRGRVSAEHDAIAAQPTRRRRVGVRRRGDQRPSRCGGGVGCRGARHRRVARAGAVALPAAQCLTATWLFADTRVDDARAPSPESRLPMERAFRPVPPHLRAAGARLRRARLLRTRRRARRRHAGRRDRRDRPVGSEGRVGARGAARQEDVHRAGRRDHLHHASGPALREAPRLLRERALPGSATT
jgi:hypothetical protein